MSSSPQENAVRLLDILNSTADVEINDEATHSLFGDLYSGQQILEALIEAATTTYSTTTTSTQQDNVGMPLVIVPDNAAAISMVMVRSLDNPLTTFLSMQLETITPHEMPLEIHNLSNVTLRLRWINQDGGSDASSHQWNIPPQSTFEQYCQPGHLFVLSVVPGGTSTNGSGSSSSEQIVGAYRPRRPLPSLTAHALLVQEISPSLFLLETILLDATRFDALSVAAADLDYHYSVFKEQQRESLEQTIHLLHTIVKNVVVHHIKEEKYHQLKLANSKMRRFIVNSWGAMEMLTILGFVEKTNTIMPTSSSSENTPSATTDHHRVDDEKEQCLVMATPTPQATLDIGQHALHLLDILQSRVSAQFVSELAPPTPWQPPPDMGSSNMEGGQDTARTAAAAGRGGFVISDDERWARAERGARLRRSGGGRPSPGNAPSSRGKWGR